MKVLKLPENAEYTILLEKGDRFVQLNEGETAIVLCLDEDTNDVKVTVHMPKLGEDEEIPLTVSLAAAVKEFLHSPELITETQKKLQKRAEEGR